MRSGGIHPEKANLFAFVRGRKTEHVARLPSDCESGSKKFPSGDEEIIFDRPAVRIDPFDTSYRGKSNA